MNARGLSTRHLSPTGCGVIALAALVLDLRMAGALAEALIVENMNDQGARRAGSQNCSCHGAPRESQGAALSPAPK